MKKHVMFCSVGSTPQAFANALTWFLNLKNEKYPVSDIYFIASEENKGKGIPGTQENIPKAIKMIKESLNILKPEILSKVTFHEKAAFLVPEEDVIKATTTIIRKIRELVKEDQVCIIEMTAGRKTMSSALLMAGTILNNRFKLNVLLTYYWLVRWTRENLKKKAHQLGIDDVYTLIIDPRKLYEEVEKIN
ncbi:MAG: hypothetical protein ACTSVI_00165 [Promethearchaeota archaeon]